MGILRVLLLAAALVAPAAAESRVSVVVSRLEVLWTLALAPDGADDDRILRLVP